MNNSMLKRQTQTTQQHGVTLLELMVAMAVSSFIMLGISNIYLSTKKSYVIHDEFSRIQENGRYATETLSTNIRNAGFFGCSSGQGLGAVTNGLNQTQNSPWNFETGLMGYEAVGTDFDQPATTIDPTVSGGPVASWVTAAGLTSSGVAISPNPDAVVAGLALIGSDILILRTADDLGVRIVSNNNGAQVFVEDTTGGYVANSCPQNAGGGGFNVNGISGICERDILLVSDCTKSRIFQASSMSTANPPGQCPITPCFNLRHAAAGTPGNADVTWMTGDGETFGPDSEVMTVVTKTYFVGVPVDAVGAPLEPSLYERINDAPVPTPIVEGIENMQVLYGVDTNGDGVANQYFSANDVPDVDGDADTVFEGVVSVKISLLARTPQNLPGINRTAADFAALTYPMVSPASPITINPFQPGSTDRRMRKVFNLTLKLRNKSFNIAN